MGRRLNAGLKRTLINPVTGLFSAAGAVMASKRLLEYEDALLAVRVQAGLTAEETARLDKNIMSAANASRQSRDDMLAAFSEILDKTGNFDLAANGIRDIGIAATATTSEVFDMAAMAKSLNLGMGITGDQMGEVFNILNSQGKQGSFVFGEMATQAERLFSAAAGAAGLKGLDGLREFGAFLQMIRPSFGSADEAATMVKNIAVRLKTEADTIKDIAGVDVFENGQLRSFATLIKEIVSGTSGDTAKLNEIFGEASIAFSQFNKELEEGRGFDKFESFLRVSGSNQLWNDFLTKSQSGKNRLVSLSNVITQISDASLSNPLDKFISGLEGLLEEPQRVAALTSTFETLGSTLGVIAGWTIKVAEGWGYIFDGLEKGAERLANTVYGVNDVDALKESYRAKWNELPKEQRLSAAQRLNNGQRVFVGDESAYATGQLSKWARENLIVENQITINQDSDGRIVSVASDGNSKTFAKSNRGGVTATF
jgi:hypothetical protein